MTKSSCSTRIIVDKRSGKIFKRKNQQHKSKVRSNDINKFFPLNIFFRNSFNHLILQEENCAECEFSSKNRLLLMMHIRFEHQVLTEEQDVLEEQWWTNNSQNIQGPTYINLLWYSYSLHISRKYSYFFLNLWFHIVLFLYIFISNLVLNKKNFLMST